MAFNETAPEWKDYHAMRKSQGIRKYDLEDDMFERAEEAREAQRGLELLGKLKDEMSQLYNGYRLAECGNLLEKFAEEFGGWAYSNGPVKSELMEIRRALFEMEGKAQELYHAFDRLVDDIESTLSE